MNDVKLTEIFVANGMKLENASQLAQKLYTTLDKTMFRAILWGFAKFGTRATYDTEIIETVMDNGRLNEFQAIAKIAHTQLVK